MKTVHADFSQISENGANVAEGEIFIKKPGKARITYSNSPMEIITVGTWLVQYDKKTKGTTYIDLKSVPLYFILQPNAAFREYVNVLGIVQSASNTKIIATLKQNKASDGQITIVFGENPLRLEGWIIHPTGAKPIVVNLRNVKMNCPISDEVFKFDDPRIRDKLGSTD
ncbi:LolA family protein [Candidatus Hydrogenosomobacter endosymbioticus]|nr:outer-membrane lipoprotein carrier protein LolA [Candidatus Hydrogenosomobacter endosymbioticus]